MEAEEVLALAETLVGLDQYAIASKLLDVYHNGFQKGVDTLAAKL